MNQPIEFKILSRNDTVLLDQVETLWKEFYEGMRDQGLSLTLVEGGEGIWRRSIELSLGRTNQLVVAVSDGKVIGFALGSLRIAPEFLGGHLHGFVSGLYVLPGHRKTNIGTRLNNALEEWFSERKAHTYELQVLVSNQAAIKFWEQLGYRGELYQMRKIPSNNP